MFIYCFIWFLFVAVPTVPTVPTSPSAFLFSENGFILFYSSMAHSNALWLIT